MLVMGETVKSTRKLIVEVITSHTHPLYDIENSQVFDTKVSARRLKIQV